jgi:outer membrane protein assembly factor BamB
LKQWPEGGPPLAWTANKAGLGYGSPAIADGKVFLMGNGEKMEYVVCLDENSGEQIWACFTGSLRSGGGGYPGPRCTPTFADGKIYVMGLAGRVVCCDAKTGQPIWYREMTRDFGGWEPRWGYSESVLVDGDRVICTPGMEKTVVALDARTGKEIWAAHAGDPASYSSVVKAVFAETPQYVAFTQRGLVGIRASDGAILWRYDKPSNGQANCPTPVVLGSTVFAASGYGRGGGCVWIRKDEEGTFSPQELYSTNKMQNQHGGFVVVDGYLYGCSDPGVLVCLNYKTGKVTKAIRTGRFSIAYADGMLYLRKENGRVDLYEASSTKLTRRGTFEQPHRSKLKAWPHPVIANGRLYLRDQYVVLCYDIAEEKPDSSANGEETEPSQ